MRDIALSDFVIKYFMTKTLKTYLKTAAKDYKSRSVNPPVVRASTILFKSMQELRKHQKDIAKKKRRRTLGLWKARHTNNSSITKIT